MAGSMLTIGQQTPLELEQTGTQFKRPTTPRVPCSVISTAAAKLFRLTEVAIKRIGRTAMNTATATMTAAGIGPDIRGAQLALGTYVDKRGRVHFDLVRCDAEAGRRTGQSLRHGDLAAIDHPHFAPAAILVQCQGKAIHQQIGTCRAVERTAHIQRATAQLVALGIQGKTGLFPAAASELQVA